jgi:hypothetical protein
MNPHRAGCAEDGGRMYIRGGGDVQHVNVLSSMISISVPSLLSMSQSHLLLFLFG